MILALMIGLVGSLACGGDPLRIAVFEGNGVGRSTDKLIAAIQGQSDADQVTVVRISADDIRAGGLTNVEVLVHPGGSGSKQGKSLGEDGRRLVRQFVEQGGGYLGVCAGAYLATNDYDWSLDLIDAKVVDRMHWARGTGSVKLRLSDDGIAFFEQMPTIDLHYGQGPLLARREWDDVDVPDYESLAIYDSEIATKGAPKGIMKGTSAIVRCRYGSGRVFCFSPHPELTDGKSQMIATAVAWLAADEKSK